VEDHDRGPQLLNAGAEVAAATHQEKSGDCFRSCDTGWRLYRCEGCPAELPLKGDPPQEEVRCDGPDVLYALLPVGHLPGPRPRRRRAGGGAVNAREHRHAVLSHAAEFLTWRGRGFEDNDDAASAELLAPRGLPDTPRSPRAARGSARGGLSPGGLVRGPTPCWESFPLVECFCGLRYRLTTTGIRHGVTALCKERTGATLTAREACACEARDGDDRAARALTLDGAAA
jgi:hypothetical protein